MKIHIFEQLLEYKNSPEYINDLLKEIDCRVQKSNCILSHLQIDNINVYSDFENYIADHIHDIQEVHVIVTTSKQLSYEVINTSAEYIKRVIPEVKSLADHFYNTPSREAWLNLISLFEGIKWIIDSFVLIDSSYKMNLLQISIDTWTLYSKEIESLYTIIQELEESLQNEDCLMVADLLSYEVIPLFKKMESGLDILVKYNNEE